MFNFPPIPEWDSFHPLVVHFPIGLLLLAPVLVVLGLVWKSKSKGFLLSAFVVMLLGTVAAFVAVSTGEAASELVERSDAISRALERHEELAETTRLIFTILTVLFGVLLLLPVITGKQATHRTTVVLGVLFLVVYSVGALSLANTAHNGGRLVHGYGVQAMIDSGQD
jgi:uncharacterized membrane protein